MTGRPLGAPRRVHDGVARIWQFDPQPVTGDVRRLKSWVEVMTGRELGPDGTTRVLDADTWRARRGQLQALGGSPIP